MLQSLLSYIKDIPLLVFTCVPLLHIVNDNLNKSNQICTHDAAMVVIVSLTMVSTFLVYNTDLGWPAEHSQRQLAVTVNPLLMALRPINGATDVPTSALSHTSI